MKTRHILFGILLSATFCVGVLLATPAHAQQDSWSSGDNNIDMGNGSNDWNDNPAPTTSSKPRSSTKHKPRHTQPQAQQNQQAAPSSTASYGNDGLHGTSCNNGAGQWDASTQTCITKPTNNNAPTSGNSTSSAATSQSADCRSRIRDEVQKCVSVTSQANSDCDDQKNSDVQNAKDSLSQLTNIIGPQLAANDICSKVAEGVSGVNLALQAFGQACSGSRDICASTCQQAQADLNKSAICFDDNAGIDEMKMAPLQKSMTDQTKSCNALKAKVADTNSSVQNLIGAVQASRSCANSLALTQYCQSNPNAVGCNIPSTDCSNPQVAATSLTCICISNAADPRCTGALRAASNNGSSMGTLPSTTAPTGTPSGAPDFSSTAGWNGDPGLKGDSAQPDDPNGSKGGRALLAGDISNGGGPAGTGAAQGANGANTNVNAGLRGGSGGGGWGGYRGASGSDANQQAQRVAAAGPGGPDLRKFLPNGQMRGIAGVTGPDGITGPNSDIWQKIQNRYNFEMPH